MNLESANLFAALDTKKKKKSKSSKDHDKKKKPDKAEKAAELDKAIFSQPAPTTTNWADDDEFDDDFENDLGPLPESWAQAQNSQPEAAEEDGVDSDEEVDQQAIEEALGIELGKDDDEEDEEQEDEHSEDEEPATTSADDEATKKATTEQQKQLSKKEQKKKELEELNAMLAEMGVAPKEAESDAGGTAPSGKKKKKKDKAAVKENAGTAVNGNGVAPNEQPKAEQPSSEQTQESIEGGFKKVPPKVKKPSAKKSSSAIAAAAAAEAKARAAKKGNKKDKSTFNQAPTR